MGFQIKNKDGEGVLLNTLDKEAAELWGKEVDDDGYAFPGDNVIGLSWFDFIGWKISHPGDWTKGWDNVKNDLWISALSGTMYNKSRAEVAEKALNAFDYLKPYIDLIDLWESKGYTPHKVD